MSSLILIIPILVPIIGGYLIIPLGPVQLYQRIFH